MMSYFLPYGNKQTVEKAVVQNLCIDEHEQPGEVLVQDSIKAGLPAPGNTECSSSPPSHGCSNSDVSATPMLTPINESFCSVFQGDWSFFLLSFFLFLNLGFAKTL